MAAAPNKSDDIIMTRRKTIFGLIAVLCLLNVSVLYQNNNEGSLLTLLLNNNHSYDQPTTATSGSAAAASSFNSSNVKKNNNNNIMNFHEGQYRHQQQKAIDVVVPPPKTTTTTNHVITSNNNHQSMILSSKERPNCGSGCLYFYWTGKSKLPPMYEACLKSAIKVFGPENIVVVSSVLEEPLSWNNNNNNINNQIIFPQPPSLVITIWNITTTDLAYQLVDETQIHTYQIWEDFLSKLNSNAHIADFVRIALIYLYGGIYTDFDNIWIKPIPLQYPVVTTIINNNSSSSSTIDDNNRHHYPAKWNGKKLFRVRVDRRRKGKKLINTNNYNYTHNAVVGGIPRSSFHRYVLEVMPSSYNPNHWVSIGDAILLPAVTYCNCIEDFVEIEYLDMYGIYGADAIQLYNQPIDYMKPKDQKVVDHVLHESYQLHLFGSKTKSTEKLPADGSLYRILLDHLNISVTEN